MEASSSAPNELALLLEDVATQLRHDELLLLLRDLPTVELARLACVHKAYLVGWRSLQQQYQGKRYAPPDADNIRWSKGRTSSEEGDV